MFQNKAAPNNLSSRDSDGKWPVSPSDPRDPGINFSWGSLNVWTDTQMRANNRSHRLKRKTLITVLSSHCHSKAERTWAAAETWNNEDIDADRSPMHRPPPPPPLILCEAYKRMASVEQCMSDLNHQRDIWVLFGMQRCVACGHHCVWLAGIKNERGARSVCKV